MVRVLVLMEDHSQMTQTRTLLNKVGCDVEAASSEVGLKEKAISFRPDVLLISGVGKKINGASVSKRLSEIVGFSGKIILILAPGVKISLNDLAENKYDAFLESPYDPMQLLALISKFSDGKAPELVSKFQKLAIEGALGRKIDNGSERQVIKGKFPIVEGDNYGPPSEKDLKDKIIKYSQLVEGIKISPISTISKAAANLKVKEMKKKWDRKLLDNIDEEKRKVTRLLFKK